MNLRLLLQLILITLFQSSCFVFPKLNSDSCLGKAKPISKTDIIDANGIGSLNLGLDDDDVKCRCKGLREYSPGGIGNVMRIGGWNGGIRVINRYNQCDEIIITRISLPFLPFIKRSPWVGKTKRGIKLGDSFKKFKEIYPEAKYQTEYSGWQIGVEARIFIFDAFGKLNTIIIG